MCDALSFLLDNIYIRFGTKLYKQILGIPMGTNCAPLVADLFSFCYEIDFMKNLSSDNQADVIKAFNLTSRYLDDLLNIDNPYFEGMVNQIYPPELQLNKANTSDTDAPVLDLHLPISNGFVSSKIYDKRDDFDFDIVNSKFNVGLKSLLHQGLSEPEFYGDLVYKFKKIRGMNDFSDQFKKIIMCYKRIGYNLNVMRQSACLVINPITVDGYAALFNCTPVDRASGSMMALT